MPLIPFPNVPKLPGVPAIPRLPGLGTAQSALRSGAGILQSALWKALQSDSQWGIFDKNGKALGDPSKMTGVLGALAGAAGIGAVLSTNGVEFTREFRISDFPVEQGSFASYNKVQTPANAVVTFAFTGKESERQTFLEAIDTACKSMDLYDVVTPEAKYQGYSIERYNYQRRQSKGANLLIVELFLREIRQIDVKLVAGEKPAANTEGAKKPDAKPPKAAGKVLPKAPDQSLLSQAASGIKSGLETFKTGIKNMLAGAK